MNNVFILGRITDLKGAQNPQGFYITNFTIVVNRKVKTKENGYIQKSTFIPCKALGNRGKAIFDYFTKGDLILVKGEVEIENWEHKGKKYYKTLILVQEFEFIQNKNNKENNQNNDNVNQNNPTSDNYDMEIPF